MAVLYELDLVKLQKQLRLEVAKLFSSFSLDLISTILEKRKKIEELQIALITATVGSRENLIFRNEKLLLDSIFMLFEWCEKVLLGSQDAEIKRNAAIANINLFDLNSFSYLEVFDHKILEIKLLINEIDTSHLDNVKNVVKLYLQLQHPTIAYLNSDNSYKIDFSNNEEVKELKTELIVISLEFYLQETPWANPQVLKAKEIYTITGSLKFNKFPENFKILKILSATTSSEIFELKLSDIEITNELEYKVEGTLLFKYAQSNFEDNLSIKLVPYLIGNAKEELQPVIIGYDELNAKILDQNNSLFQTGFETINKKVFEIYTNPLLTKIGLQDRNEFITLLNGIANFQGYCLQSGLYKNVSSLKEDQFRDKLIQHLIAIPQIGEKIVKESQVAGGRVEISYKGHIAELKVETVTSDRAKLMSKFSSQAVAYASGNGKLASIVCILDLTEKLQPPGSPANNIILKSPSIHGFDSVQPNAHVQVFIFIDGNTKNPSDYSK
ncbi:hypothetical protein ACYE2N_05060 [Flavobacterium sp. MAHUQ-51]|uniref:hypothetical protein n=1 Tax=Flavobacterium sp. GCM10022190 TaxID=3252639 RepID=UPI0036178FF8